MNDGLKVAERQAIRRVFADYPQIKVAWLYGSRALGRHRPGSDIDLSLSGELDLKLLNRISNALDDLLLPYEIDLSAFEQIENTVLREHIERVGQVFYRKDNNE